MSRRDRCSNQYPKVLPRHNNYESIRGGADAKRVKAKGSAPMRTATKRKHGESKEQGKGKSKGKDKGDDGSASNAQTGTKDEADRCGCVLAYSRMKFTRAEAMNW